jgi:tetratricopeptide (TPR) repeat protein
MNKPPSRKLVVGLACALGLGVLAWLSIQIYLAAEISDQANLAELQRAVRLQPLNADYWHRLGRYYFYQLQDSSQALDDYQKAAKLNSHSPRLWLDMADVYLVTGNRNLQEQALERALASDPTTPSVIWEVANSYLAEGKTEAGLAQLKVLVDHDPESQDRVVELAWRVTHDERMILLDVLPPRPEPQLSFVDFLSHQDEAPAAAHVWSNLISLQQPFSAKLALPYMQFLIERGDGEHAERVWQELAARDRQYSDYLPTDNLVVDPSFEYPILNAGLDWRYQAFNDVVLNIDTSESHSGNKSLSCAFNGAVSDVGIAQYVPVRPGTEYEFSSFYKIEGLEGAGGLQWAVIDPADHSVMVLSEPLTDANGWQKATATFKTDSETTLVLLKLLRLPQGNILRGKVWIDDVAVVQKSSAPVLAGKRAKVN